MIPDDFLFSQTSLQDFVDCRRRFYLRYIQKVRWPAVQSEPVLENERFIAEGSALHESIHQDLLGIPEGKIGSIKYSPRFELWWSHFLDYKNTDFTLTNPQIIRLPEFTLIGTIAGYKLVAKYDLLAINPGEKATIYDWKTAQKKPRRTWLLKRMQSLIYPVILMKSGQHLLPAGINPENISMVYWFANHRGQHEVIEYSTHAFEQDSLVIEDMIRLIDRLAQGAAEDNFPMTEDKRKCAFCSYRSLCNTGIQAGRSEEIDEVYLEELEFDFEQINEVPF
jgi:hypothetical protein